MKHQRGLDYKYIRVSIHESFKSLILLRWPQASTDQRTQKVFMTLDCYVIFSERGLNNIEQLAYVASDSLLRQIKLRVLAHTPLEIEFKSRGSNSNAQRYYPWAVRRLSTREKRKQRRGEFITPPRPTGRWGNNLNIKE